jgi:hypothetical protein
VLRLVIHVMTRNLNFNPETSPNVNLQFIAFLQLQEHNWMAVLGIFITMNWNLIVFERCFILGEIIQVCSKDQSYWYNASSHDQCM